MANEGSKNRKSALVLGMHRSGTSALMRVINLCGVDIGNKLMPPSESSNPKGFWEHQDIYEINEKLLFDLNSSWDDVRSLPVGWWETDLAQQYKLSISNVLERDFSDSPFWGLKDPRMCILLPLWQPLLEKIVKESYYFIIIRNPLEVIDSLIKRNGFSTGKSSLLWLKYLIEAEKGTRNTKRIFTTYEELLTDCKGLLKRAEKILDIKWPVSYVNATIAIDDFLDKRLRNNFFLDSVIHKDKSLNRWMRDVYFALRDAKDGSEESIIKIFSSVYDDFKDIDKLYNPVVSELCDRNKSSNNILKQQGIKIERLNTKLKHTHIDIGKQNTEIIYLKTLIKENEKQYNALLSTHANLKTNLLDKDQTIKVLSLQLANKEKSITNLREEVQKIYQSKSWSLTKPLRDLRRIAFTIPYRLFKQYSSEVVRAVWYKLPVQSTAKVNFKNMLFIKFPFFFRHTVSYSDWITFTRGAPSKDLKKIENKGSYEPIDINVENCINKISILDKKPIASLPVKLIAFYLPQFHPIKENDKHWGEGFTEWTNVKKGTPQFKGHYQPHVPGDLGYYDLRSKDIQQKQIEIAKIYGISGFCFYFYWFDGKRPLELPIKNYFDNKKLDFPFCLCWANENWTRRWDGLDNDIILRQSYSADDDLKFITYISRYLKDSRYIRIQGKPLLIVYRPDLFPSAFKTAKRWRIWCQENDIGDIFLAYTQSFETTDPSRYGFDAAIEFPPNNSNPPVITDRIANLASSFSGIIYDWRIFKERSYSYNEQNYNIFRGVCPSWDNSPRMKNRGKIFLNSTPHGYQEWLYNACKDTVKRFEDIDERLIFINAWNEWAEGTHLEPDEKYGYAYLEATRMALLRNKILSDNNTPRTIKGGNRNSSKNQRLAIIIHAFYIDVFEEIISYLKNVYTEFKLFVTCTKENEAKVRSLIEKNEFSYFILTLENRGRDIRPFMKIIDFAISENYSILLKIHTKKSKHRLDGKVWRKDIYQKLLSGCTIRNSMQKFELDADVGMIGPKGHIVPMSYYLGSNKEYLTQISLRMGIYLEDMMRETFVAGSMFFARTKAILPLLNISIDDNEYKDEDGQVDGTLAHAIERAFSLSVKAANMKLIDTSGLYSEKVMVDVVRDYRYVNDEHLKVKS